MSFTSVQSPSATQERLSARELPPRLPGGGPLGHLLAFRADPLGFASRARAECGDTVLTRLGPERPIFVFGPDDVKHVLVDHHQNYDKQTRGYALLRTMLGNGLVTSEGDFWRRQRRIAQPAFHKQRLARLAEVMQRSADELADAWQAPAARGTTVDVADAMMHLTLKIAGLTLFSLDLADESEAVGGAVTAMLTAFQSLISMPLPWAEHWPTPTNLRGKRAMKQLDRVVYDIIAERRRSGEQTHDLLGMFMEARDEETGEGMSDVQLRDEVLTMLTAGHETTANALAWTFYLLSKHPDVARRVEAEIDALGHLPGVADLARLTYTDQVLSEVMRLYPPVWMLARRAVEDDVLGGFRVPAGTYVILAPYVTQRHPGHWENPEGFDPERFAPGRAHERAKLAYFPFAAGPRKCIGDHFARMEALLVIATLVQRYRLELMPGREVLAEPNLTLRPKGGLPMTLRARHEVALAAE
jgi:cytochrome P450